MIDAYTFVKFLSIAIISYLLGSLNFSIILSRSLTKKDIRESGSGNAGATNMLRTYGKKYAALTMLGDVFKVFIAVAIAFAILQVDFKYLFVFPRDAGDQTVLVFQKEFAGFFCLLGHIFPCFFKFKGGKGMAACTGMVILVDWRIALILFVIFAAIVAISKMISLGSVTIAVLFPVLITCFYKNLFLTLIAVLFAVIVITAHRENIKRLIKGTENKISFKK